MNYLGKSLVIFTLGLLVGGSVLNYYHNRSIPLDKDNVSSSNKNILDEAKVVDIIQNQIKTNPKLIYDSVQNYLALEQAKNAQDANTKFLTYKSTVEDDTGLPYVGNGDSNAIKVFYFFDSNCPFCKKIEPILSDFSKKYPNIKIVHREMPFLGEVSQYAAILNQIVWSKYPDKYSAFHSAVMNLKGSNGGHVESIEAVNSVVKDIFGETDGQALIGLMSDKTNGSPEDIAEGKVSQNLQVASLVEVTGTPVLYIPLVKGIIRGVGPDFEKTLENYILDSEKLVKSN